MGRPISRDFEGELVIKFKALFDKIVEGVNKEHPSFAFDFERFVDSFNTDDYITKQVFEFLVKETAHSYRRSNPYDRIPPFPRPPTIHHTTSSLAPGGGSSSPFTSLSSSLSSLAFGQDRAHSDEAHSDGEQATTGSGSGLVAGTGMGASAGSAVRGLQRSLTPNSAATTRSTSLTRIRPWTSLEQGATGPELDLLTHIFNRSRERRSRERTRPTLGSGQFHTPLDYDNSDDSDDSDDSIYESIAHSRSIMGTMHDSEPSPTHSPGGNTSQSSTTRQNNSVSFAQLYNPLSASPSSPTTFSSSPSSHSTFSSSYWDSSTASRADRLQRMSRYIFDDSGMPRLRQQQGYINTLRQNWRNQHRRLERYRASASLLDSSLAGQSSSSSQPSIQPATTAQPTSSALSATNTTVTVSGSGSTSTDTSITTRPDSLALSRSQETARNLIEQTEDRYNSFSEASRRGREALRSAVLALEETVRSVRTRYDDSVFRDQQAEGSTTATANAPDLPRARPALSSPIPIQSAHSVLRAASLQAEARRHETGSSSSTSTMVSGAPQAQDDNCETGGSSSSASARPSEETVADLAVSAAAAETTGDGATVDFSATTVASLDGSLPPSASSTGDQV
ncbi:hypothetical protein BGX23_006666 [Mortierella sp. AD031]|nr:hypothetical protein BGX23_006666 [Mortierella sp. AD031]